ncbi:hypothetical protein [Flagellimonas sp. S3867]|uniref:hypothetical protein n=1 Tax=Flagellimonas sp. S3867 TaxID=2768063 RepID=UPI001681E788|nr:hypothetical protein [Flagellimonas sp. S3867]
MDSEKLKIIDWKPKWDGGAPMPKVYNGDFKTYLTYVVADWDEESISEFKTLEHDGYAEYFALVGFHGKTFKFGIANDEVFSGLPLYSQGLEWAQTIENSKWIEELKTIHKVHPYFNESKWENRKHYLLTFKDEIFEIIATGFEIEIFKTSYKRMAQEVVERING